MPIANIEALASFALGPLICFHGGEHDLIEQVCAGTVKLGRSTNDNDWLGHGTYFWVGSKERAQEWAEQKQQRGLLHKPSVLGALIYPCHCLNLMDYGVFDEVNDAHAFLLDVFKKAKKTPPENGCLRDGVLVNRQLDDMVIETVHQLRRDANLPEYDTVMGAFEEGPHLFKGSTLRQKTHLQIAVRNPSCILRYFSP